MLILRDWLVRPSECKESFLFPSTIFMYTIPPFRSCISYYCVFPVIAWLQFCAISFLISSVPLNTTIFLFFLSSWSWQAPKRGSVSLFISVFRERRIIHLTYCFCKHTFFPLPRHFPGSPWYIVNSYAVHYTFHCLQTYCHSTPAVKGHSIITEETEVNKGNRW